MTTMPLLLQPCFRPVFFVVFFTALFVLFSQHPAKAHHLRVFAYVDGPEIVVEGNFGENRPAKLTDVSVYNATTSTKLLAGKTDQGGIFRFIRPDIPSKDSVRITLNSGQGHQGSWTLTPRDLGQTEAEAPVLSPPTVPVPQPLATNPAFSELELRQLTEVIEKTVARKIEPLQQMLAENLDPAPTLRDIIGGTGWLVGIAGLLAVWRNKQ